VFESYYAPFYGLEGRQDGVIGVSIQITGRVHAERALRVANQDLEQSNTDLETRVAERTAQLGQAIKRLGQAYRRLARINRQLQQAKLDLEWELAERERAETALEAYAMQLERTNRDLQDFASIASHDLQEPLRKIQAFGDRLLHGTAIHKLNVEEQDFLERLVRSAASMSAMIRDLLAYSRLSILAQPAAPVDLAAAAREVLSNLEVRIEHTGGSVEIGRLPTIEADPLQMRQLLQNLIGNALKYHRPGVPPVVRVWARTRDDGRGDKDHRLGDKDHRLGDKDHRLGDKDHRLGDKDHRLTKNDGGHDVGGGQNSGDEAYRDPSSRRIRQVEIVVEDNGIGFDEQYAERIFQPFQRLVGRSEYEGSGIGLAICRKIVERHGGAIRATGIPGQGAKIIIRLPVKQ
jgi:signal transduction histidine kinase